MYIIPGYVQVKDAIAFVHGDTLTAVATTGADPQTGMVVEMHNPESDDVEGERGGGVPKAGTYFISSETPGGAFSSLY